VTGDVISFAQLVRINGPVDGNVRAFANTLSLTAAVGKNVTAFAENIDLDSKAQIGGGMMLFAADTALNGRLNRDLFGFIGRTLLNGFIGGNVRLKSGHLTITERAQIEGKARYEGEHQPAVSPQAKLASPLEIHIVAHHPAYTTARFYIRQLLRWGAAFIFGMLIALLMPSFYGDVVRASHRYGLSLGIGALTLAAGCILALVSLLLLLIRMPVGVMVLLLYFPAIYAAQVFVASWIGDKLLGPATSSSEILGRLALGLIIIRVLGMIPVLGALVWLAVILWGVGALVFSFYSRSRPQPALA